MTSAAKKPQDDAAAEDEDVKKGVSSYQIAYRQFKKDKVAVFAFLFLVFMGAVSIFSPLLANSKPIVCSYQGNLHFPAFQDYLDPNFPVPRLIADWIKTFGPFSPKYPEIERPAGELIPDWRRITREIDTGEEGWYLRPPIKHYYSETSRGLKLMPGRSLGKLVLPAPEGQDPETLTVVPGRESLSELRPLRRLVSTPEGEEAPRALVVWSERLGGWCVQDVTELGFERPRGWTECQPLRPGVLQIGLRPRSDAAEVAIAWEWRSRYLRQGDELTQDEDSAQRFMRQWLSRLRSSDFDWNQSSEAIEAAAKQASWTTLAGFPAVTLSTYRPDDAQGEHETVFLAFTDYRVYSLTLRTQAKQDEVDHGAFSEQLRTGVQVFPASGKVRLGGEVVSGQVAIRDGETLDYAGVPVEFYRAPTFHLGTDNSGRDVASRLIHGTVIAGSVGLISVGIYVFIGIIVGALAGYFRGWVDLVLSRIIEIVICFPTLFLIMMVVSFWRSQSIYLIMITLGLIRWTGVARLVRGEFLKIMSEEYVAAARSLGLSTPRIIFRHILPNAISPVFVSASFGVAGAILVESSLSFLGFGVAPPAPSWGEMLNQGKQYINEGLWHLVWMPGAAIFVTVTMFNLVGEGLRDALDPKLRQ
ncbi:MAG: ABC transporter permease subunit [Planctomycetota bacterium]